jgi:hypothetical protein
MPVNTLGDKLFLTGLLLWCVFGLVGAMLDKDRRRYAMAGLGLGLFTAVAGLFLTIWT